MNLPLSGNRSSKALPARPDKAGFGGKNPFLMSHPNHTSAASYEAIAPGNMFHVNKHPDTIYTFSETEASPGCILVEWPDDKGNVRRATYSLKDAREYVRAGLWIVLGASTKPNVPTVTAIS